MDNQNIEAEVIEPETNINEQIETETEEPETNINEQIETEAEEHETNANEQTETKVVDQKSNKTEKEKKTRNKIKNDDIGEKYEKYKEMINNGVSIKDIKKLFKFSNEKMSILDLIYEKEKDGTLYSNSFLMKYLKNKPGNKTLGQVKDKGIFIPFHVLKKINADEIFSKGTYYSYELIDGKIVIEKK